jgi:hypothetical protein
MPVKIAKSGPRPAFGLPEALVAVHTSRLSYGKAGKTRIYTPIRASFGESQSKCRNRNDVGGRRCGRNTGPFTPPCRKLAAGNNE